MSDYQGYGMLEDGCAFPCLQHKNTRSTNEALKSSMHISY